MPGFEEETGNRASQVYEMGLPGSVDCSQFIFGCLSLIEQIQETDVKEAVFSGPSKKVMVTTVSYGLGGDEAEEAASDVQALIDKVP